MQSFTKLLKIWTGIEIQKWWQKGLRSLFDFNLIENIDVQSTASNKSMISCLSAWQIILNIFWTKNTWQHKEKLRLYGPFLGKVTVVTRLSVQRVYFWPLNPQKCLLLIWLTYEWWKGESLFKLLTGFVPRTPGLSILTTRLTDTTEKRK